VASLSQGRTAAAQCGLFTYKSVPVIFEPPCISLNIKHSLSIQVHRNITGLYVSRKCKMSTKVKKLVSSIFVGNKIGKIINVNIECHVIKIIMKISIDEVRPWKFNTRAI